MGDNGCFDIPPVSLPADDRVKRSYLIMNDENGVDVAFAIRKATVSDVRDILELVNGFAGNNLMLPRGPQYLYENIRDFVVAVTENTSAGAADQFSKPPDHLSHGPKGQIIACASLHVLWEDVAEIRSVAIRSGYQHKGLGKRLIDFLKTDARSLGIHTLFTFTLADDFFKALGFVPKKKEELPPKVWGECSRCPKFFKCDEVGMILMI